MCVFFGSHSSDRTSVCSQAYRQTLECVVFSQGSGNSQQELPGERLQAIPAVLYEEMSDMGVGLREATSSPGAMTSGPLTRNVTF